MPVFQIMNTEDVTKYLPMITEFIEYSDHYYFVELSHQCNFLMAEQGGHSGSLFVRYGDNNLLPIFVSIVKDAFHKKPIPTYLEADTTCDGFIN